MSAVEHITTTSYHLRCNRQAEPFVDTLKRAMDGIALQQFLRMYRVTPNLNIPAGSSPAELMFARKVKLVLSKFLLGKTRISAGEDISRFFEVGDKVYMSTHRNGKQNQEDGKITKVEKAYKRDTGGI